MGDLMGQLVTWTSDVISTLGYVGVAFIVALETLFPPIPSEVILPLSGSLVASGKFNVFLVIAAATVGSLVGALALYGIGRWAGAERVGGWLDRYGKWLFLSRSDLERSQEWFDRRGDWAVFLGRLVPGVRSFISVPAGLSEMPVWRFLVATSVGSALWNGILIGAGYLLGQNWRQVESFLAPISSIIYVLIAVIAALFIGQRLLSRFGSADDIEATKAEQPPDDQAGAEGRPKKISPWFSRRR